MLLKKFYSAFVAVLFAAIATAQNASIHIKITTDKGEAFSGATIYLIAVPDTVNVLQQVSDSAGNAAFMALALRPYQLRISATGYATLEKNILVKEGGADYSFVLQPDTKTLGAVTVRSTRPLMRQQDDKTIVDPENLAAVSTNAYEIIEKVPGLFVDGDGNIYLNSTTPAIVYINGREQRMSAADMATLLKSLPPSAIASIEVLRTPSARYDASGSGGVVNVILKKGVRIGLTGSVNAGFNQGRFGNRFVGFNLNNNNGRLTTYLNAQYSRRNTYDELTTSRYLTPDTLLQQNAYTRFPTQGGYVGAGASYQLSKNWDVAYDARINYNRSENNSTNLSQINRLSTNNLLQQNNTTVANNGLNYNLTQSINIKRKLDSLGSEWTADASYTYAPNNTDQLFGTAFDKPQRAGITGDGSIDNTLHFFSAQTNLVKRFKGAFTVEAGLKTGRVRFDNNTAYFLTTANNRVKDAGRTAAFRYNEDINAAYVQASKTYKGFTLKLGSRVEQTVMRGRQTIPFDTTFSINRTDPFPYVYLSRPIMKIAGYDLRAYLVYRRTITRPTYEYLNPAVRYVDPYLFETGNPSLRPQFTNNYEANVSFEERPVLAIGVNETKDIFTQVVYVADSSKEVSYRTYDNLGRNKETYFRALGALPPGGKYFFVAGVQYNYNNYNGQYEGAPLQFKRGSWTVFTYHNLKLSPLTNFSVNGFVRFKGQQQFYLLSTFGTLRASLSQQMLNKKLTVSISGEDLFFTNNNRFTLTQGSVSAFGRRVSDTRRFGLNLRYNFGLRKREQQDLFSTESAQPNN